MDDKVENIKKESEDDESKKEKTEKSEKGENESEGPLSMDIDPHHKELQEQAKNFSKVKKTDEPAAPENTSESNILQSFVGISTKFVFIKMMFIRKWN